MRNDRSFIELRARERAHALLDDGSYRELLDPFDGIMSPWLGAQGIVPQSDDGMVVAKGTINGQPAVVIAIEGTFQGGSMGEVSGGEIRAASGLVDALVNDGVNAVKTAMNEAIAKGVPVQHRSDNYDDYLRRLSQFDTRQQADTAQIKQLFAREDK
ncbi:TPA: carboxyl transferase domain-containing protein [Klebsiella pneumoniae]